MIVKDDSYKTHSLPNHAFDVSVGNDSSFSKPSPDRSPLSLRKNQSEYIPTATRELF